MTDNQILAFAKYERGKLIAQSPHLPLLNDLSSSLDSILLGFRNNSFKFCALHQKHTFSQTPLTFTHNLIY